MCPVTDSKLVSCPQCGTSVPWIPSQAYRPFCSKRCQLIDYGEWATEKYNIPADPSPDEIDSDSYPEQ